MLRLIAAVAVTVLASCAAPSAEAPPQASETPPAPYQCILPQEQRMLVAELFFGRTIKGGGFVTEALWEKFLREVITTHFPDGYTVFDGVGGWRAAEAGGTARDPTKILLVAAKRSPDLAGRLNTVMDAYKTRFHQQSVGIITRDSCAAF
jgi:hypothetical protein